MKMKREIDSNNTVVRAYRALSPLRATLCARQTGCVSVPCSHRRGGWHNRRTNRRVPLNSSTVVEGHDSRTSRKLSTQYIYMQGVTRRRSHAGSTQGGGHTISVCRTTWSRYQQWRNQPQLQKTRPRVQDRSLHVALNAVASIDLSISCNQTVRST